IQSFALRLTSPFNLPAPGRRQPLYVVFDFAETCVFVKQSPDAIHCGPQKVGTPSPEVTGLICLVPSQLHHPSALEYSSRPPVSVCGTGTFILLRGFSWHTTRRICRSGSR